MKACLVKAHVAGLGSLINNALIWSFEFENICVDWRGTLYSEGDLWPHLFQPLPPLEEPYEVQCVHPDQWCTWRQAGLLYQGKDPAHPDWRERCHAMWEKHFKVRPEIIAFADRFAEQHFAGYTVAALIRWHGHAGEQIFPHKSQSLEQYAAAIAAENPDTVYIASSDSESLAWMQVRFGTKAVWHPTARRSLTRETDLHRSVPQNERDAVEALQEILLLSRADLLIHPVSNMSTVAMYINPSLKNTFLP